MITLLFFLCTAWTTEVVMTGGVFTCPGNIALDSLGNPYIVVPKKRITTTHPLYYLFLYSKNDGTWIADTFELNLNEPPLFSRNCDLTIDRYNRVWCVYDIYREVDSTLHLIVACKDSLGWSKDTVSSGGGSFCQSIATDTAGVPHIAYDYMVDGWDRGFYANLDDTIWQKTIIDSHVTQYYCSIALDSQNNPHISYFHYHIDTTSQYEVLAHAYRIDNLWFREEIDSADNISYEMTSLAIGTTDLPGIAYRDPTTYQVKYAFYDGSVWCVDTVDFSGGFETQKSLDIDSLGQPYFIYARGYNSWLAYKDGAGWHRELLPLTPTTTKGFGGSLRIGRDGTIHIARFATNDDYTYREIHYIYGTPEGLEEGERLKVKGERLKLDVLPNIISDNAQLQYTIPEKQHISLNLYDIVGRKVATIAEGIVELGVYSDIFDFSNLSSGIYFLILKGEKETSTQKILIAK